MFGFQSKLWGLIWWPARVYRLTFPTILQNTTPQFWLESLLTPWVSKTLLIFSIFAVSFSQGICWYWWKLRYCNPCHFLSSNKNFMKNFLLIIWVCKHSDSKNNFANMLKIGQKSGNLRDFWTFFNIFAKLIFALKFRM